VSERYPVNDVYLAIQGEGSLTGVPMVILRLQGCEVGCPWCDTKETWELDPRHEVPTLVETRGTNPCYTWKSAGEISAFILSEYPRTLWILLTGGEPARYPLRPLVDTLHEIGRKVALETSGTELGHLDAGLDWITVSPKIGMPGGKKVLPQAVQSAHEIKFPVGQQRDIEQLDALLADMPPHPDTIISLQPISLNEKATQLCLETVKERNWRLSIQLHKYLHER
jgi:7-carboxy-7-deazaguanine synthase